MSSEGSGYNHTRHITITSLRRGEKISDHYLMPYQGQISCMVYGVPSAQEGLEDHQTPQGKYGSLSAQSFLAHA
jgi:hypothetical protein